MDLIKLSFGCELQCPNSMFFFEKKEMDPITGKEQTIIYQPSELVDYHIGENNYPEVSIYGDGMSDADLRKQIRNFIKRNELEGTSFRFEHKKSYNIIIDEYSINDLEFTFTYNKCQVIPISKLFIFIVNKLKEVYTKINDILEQGEVHKISNFFIKKPRFREYKSTIAPFYKGMTWYHFESIPYAPQDKPFHLITRDSPNPNRFFIQITLGIPYSKVLNVLELFCVKFLENVKEDPECYNMAYCRFFLNIKDEFIDKFGESEMIENKNVYIMFVLIKYIRHSRHDRKSYPFFIRHHITSLLKILSETEFIILQGYINELMTYDDLEFVVNAYSNMETKEELNKMLKEDNLSEQEKEYVITMRRKLNVTEDTIFGSIYHFYDNQERDKLVLVEFRWFHYLLSTFLSDEFYMNIDDLTRILPHIKSF
jgi:hypothetical protein